MPYSHYSLCPAWKPNEIPSLINLVTSSATVAESALRKELLVMKRSGVVLKPDGCVNRLAGNGGIFALIAIRRLKVIKMEAAN